MGHEKFFEDNNHSHLYYIQTYNLLYKRKELKAEESAVPTKALMIKITFITISYMYISNMTTQQLGSKWMYTFNLKYTDRLWPFQKRIDSKRHKLWWRAAIQKRSAFSKENPASFHSSSRSIYPKLKWSVIASLSKGGHFIYKVYKADTASIKDKLLWLKHILNCIFLQHFLVYSFNPVI